MGYVGAALMRVPKRSALGLTRLPKRVATRTLGGPLTITVTHGGLGATGAQLSFEDGVRLAAEALDRMFDLASSLYDRATDTVTKGLAEDTMAAAGKGFNTLTQAINDGDVAKLQRLQHMVDGATENARSELVDATVQRFILAIIAAPLATASPETLEQLKEEVRQAKPPGTPDNPIDIPLWAYGAGGLVILAVLGYFIRAIK